MTKREHSTADAALANLGNKEFVFNKNYSGDNWIYSLYFYTTVDWTELYEEDRVSSIIL